jgi:ligand-binding sensor domain-containing protein
MPPAGSIGECMGGSAGMVELDNFVFSSVHKQGIYRRNLSEGHWMPCVKGLSNLKTRGMCKLKNRIYCGTEDGVFVSDNAGLEWKPFNRSIQATMVVAITAIDGALYATTNKGKIYRTEAEEANWKELQALNSNQVIYDIQKMGDYLYLSADGQGKTDSHIYYLNYQKQKLKN